MAREWKCKRCNDDINILVPDEERKFVIDGEYIFCGKSCLQMHNHYIPVDPVRKKQNQLKKNKPKKNKRLLSKPLYKCFNCETTLERLPWNNLCPECSKNPDANMYNIRMFKISE